MEKQLAFPMPRLEIAGLSGALVVSLAEAGEPVALEISPADALTAGIWMLDAHLGLWLDPLEVPAIHGPATLKFTLSRHGAFAETTVSINAGEDPAQITLSSVQTLIAGEHLIAHSVSAGARLKPPSEALADGVTALLS